MTTTGLGTDTPRAARRIDTRRAGRITVAAGLLGAASGVAIIAWPREVPPEMFSYPLGVVSHTGFQLFFAVQQAGLLIGLLGLTQLVWPGASRPTRWGLVAANLGMAVLIAAELVELVVVVATELRTDSAAAGAIGGLFGVATFLIGGGLVAAGVGVARRHVFPGWERWLVLVIGVFVFVPLTPALMGPMTAGRLSIGAWMLLFAVLGVVLVRQADRTAEP